MTRAIASYSKLSCRSSLIADAPGKKNQPIPDNVRLYYFSSTQHNPAARPDHGICKYPASVNPRIETIRALLVAMQAWMTEGRLPPQSRFPRIADGTLVPPLPTDKFGLPSIPGVVYNGKHSTLSMNDYSVQSPRRLPGTEYPELVPKVDADGNDIDGVRSYQLQVPLGTYTGWNHRRAGYMEDELCGLQGAYIPFAKTAAERGAEPRPSLRERYGTHANYVAKVEAAVAKLVSAGFMLKEDAARVIAEAKQRNFGF